MADTTTVPLSIGEREQMTAAIGAASQFKLAMLGASIMSYLLTGDDTWKLRGDLLADAMRASMRISGVYPVYRPQFDDPS